MKVLGRVLLIAGVFVVLQPCACDELARIFAPSCPTAGHDCCGNSQGTQVHKSMGRAASLSEADQVHPPVIIVQTPALPFIQVIAVAVPLAGRKNTGLSPSAYNQPLLI